MQALTALSHGTFLALLVLALGTHSDYWRVGPFTWLPLFRLPALVPNGSLNPKDQLPFQVGLFSLLPLLLLASWLGLRLLERHAGAPRPWRWGWPGISLPLLGLTVLGIASLQPALSWNTALQLLALGLAWLVYLFIVNEEPLLTWALALIVALQGAVAVGQFIHQGDLGLRVLGELALNPANGGTNVLLADGQRWLRAYGLTGHPNLLAATLAVLLLLLLPALAAGRGWRKGLLGLAVATGLLGLLATVSRAAWLGFGTGLLVWGAGSVLAARSARWESPERRSDGRRWPANTIYGLAGLGLALIFVVVFRNMVFGRFLHLNTPIEARSLAERSRDIGISLSVIAAHPWWGVGLGSYLSAARAFDAQARVVHNIPLLVTAELGAPGLILWLCLALAPAAWIVAAWARRHQVLLDRLAPWIAFFLIGQFHSLPWISTGWRTAVLFALLAGWWTVAARPFPGHD